MSTEIKNLVTAATDGKHVSGTPLTTTLAEKVSPGLLANSIDRAIVRVRPMATPIDQISRMGHVREVDSLEVDYYSVDTRADQTDVTEVTADETYEGDEALLTLKVDDATIFEPSETFSFMHPDTSLASGYVVEKLDSETLKVLVAKADAPDIASGTTLVRLGRAATQLDVQSPQFSVLPKKKTNYCQIFKMQIEQSMIMKMSHKEIGWDFTDQQEAAVYDMRLGMEKQFLFGTPMKVYDYVKQEKVTLTQGIWSQAGKELSIRLDKFDSNQLVDLLRNVFTENSGSRRKILIAGSRMISALNKIDAQKVITSRDQVTSWGIDFSELISKFGRLYVVFSDVFDSVGMDSNGMVIDPEYIQKHVFIPFTAEKIDLRGSGQRNTEAMVLTEASCLTLRYPDAHTRLIGL